jgi:hypothetical protein
MLLHANGQRPVRVAGAQQWPVVATLDVASRDRPLLATLHYCVARPIIAAERGPWRAISGIFRV